MKKQILAILAAFTCAMADAHEVARLVQLEVARPNGYDVASVHKLRLPEIKRRLGNLGRKVVVVRRQRTPSGSTALSLSHRQIESNGGRMGNSTKQISELVDCWHEPGFPGVVWTLEGGGTTNNALEGFVENQTGKGVLRCPLTDNGATLKVSCGDADYWPTIQIVEPNDVVAEKVDYRLSDGRPAGASGGISLVTSLYVHPKDVNFEEIALEEIPWEQGGSVSGYYAQPSKLADRYHDRNHGAGHWHDVTDGNFWWKDGAGSKAITNWFAGTKIWDAPIGWNVKGKKFGYDYVKMIGSSSSFQQMFTIEADGTFRLDKFGRWVSRGVCPDGEAPDDAQILLDGGERNLAEDTERWINENNQGESVTIWW